VGFPNQSPGASYFIEIITDIILFAAFAVRTEAPDMGALFLGGKYENVIIHVSWQRRAYLPME
jgi:hypothetical protein